MARQNIDIGVQGNDGTGDSIRESFRKVNDNFIQLFSIVGSGDTISFTNLDDTPDSYGPDQIIVANAEGDALVAKDLVAGEGIAIDASDENEIRIISTGGKLQADIKPELGGHLNGQNFSIGNIANPSEEVAALFNDLHSTDITEDDLVITKGYADQRYLQGGGGPAATKPIRIRSEPNDPSEYTIEIDLWSFGYAVIEDHGFNSGSNGIAYKYYATGTTPATGLTVGETYYLRYVDKNRLSLHETREDAVNGVARIVVNDPEVPAASRGIETIVDAFYLTQDEDGYTIDGYWASNEALPRVSVVRRQGDHMAGTLYLSDHPGSLAGAGTPNGADDLQAATKYYVDNSSFASEVNLYVSMSGDDAQTNTPPGKEGRAAAYAFATLNAACVKAEEVINNSLREPGPYRQLLTYGANSNIAYLDTISPGTGSRRTLNVYTNGGGVDQSRDINNRDLREGSIIKGMQSGATGKVIRYTPPSSLTDSYLVELLHSISDINYYWTDFVNASNNLDDNKEFIKAESLEYIKSKYPSLVFNETRYTRDIDDIVDALIHDLKFGGNSKTIRVGRSYWNGTVSVIPPVEVLPRLDGLEYTYELAENIINNIAIAPAPDSVSFGKRTTLTQELSTEDPEENSVTIMRRLFDSIVNIIENGEDGDGTYLEFLEGEQLEFGQLVPETQITIRVESGVYYEQLPIRVPTNVSIKGDEFRRSIIRPAPGQSTSKWASLYFYRDDEFDGLTRTYISDPLAATSSYNSTEQRWEVTLSSGDLTVDGLEAGMYLYVTGGTGTFAPATKVTALLSTTTFSISHEPITPLTGATVRGLNGLGLAPTGNKFGYHYLTDPLGISGVFASTPTGGATVAAGLLNSNKDLIKDEVVKYINSKYSTFSYDPVLCARDVGYIVDALRYDLMFGSNFRSVKSGMAYYRANSAEVIGPQKTATLGAMAYLKELAAAAVSGIPSAVASINANMNTIINIIDNGLGVVPAFVLPNPTAYDAGFNDARRLLVANKNFIVEEITAWIDAQKAASTPPFSPSFTYDVAKCEQDVGYILDALRYDLTYGGNLETIVAARAYFVGAASELGSGEKAPTLAAYAYLKSIVAQVITATPITASPGNTIVQDVSGTAGTSAASLFAQARVQNISDTINTDGVLPVEITPSTSWVSSGLTTANSILLGAKSSFQDDVVDYVDENYAVGFVYNETLCARDVGYIVDAIVYDITNGGVSRSLAAAQSYRSNASALVAITDQLTQTLDGIGYIDALAQYILDNTAIPAATGSSDVGLRGTITQITGGAAESGADTLTQNLINGIKAIIIGTNNPAKQNKDMDMFLLNDGTILRNITGQGHGGFMCVLDPEGQIQTKSPYFQTCTSLSGSVNKKSFRGGMFIDGFCGNLPARIISKNSDTELVFDGLIARAPGVPTSFYITGARYQINAVENYNRSAGTATITLDASTPYIDPVSSPVSVTIETPGNRSMLANDFTQVNDLAYGVVATNNGLSELVSVFTYYNEVSYYANNGGQIRSLNGSSCNGVYGLKAEGSDPNEVPDPVTLADNTLTTVKVFKRDTYASKGVAGEQSIYIDNYSYVTGTTQPTIYNVSEVEIDHSNTKSSVVENTSTITDNIEIFAPGSGYAENDLIEAVGGTVYPGGLKAAFKVTGVDGTGGVTAVELIDAGTYSVNPVGGWPTTRGSFSTVPLSGSGLGCEITASFLGNIERYEISNLEITSTNTGDGVNVGGIPASRSVIKLNLNTAGDGGLKAPLQDGQIITIRGLQNFRFTGVERVKPVRPSTAVQFTDPEELNAIYRTLSYSLSYPSGATLLSSRTIVTVARSGSVATISTGAVPHGLLPGDYVTVVCTSNSSFNATSVPITVVDLYTFTYINGGVNLSAAPAAGTITYGNQSVLNFDTSFDYVILQTKPENMSGGFGDTAGDIKIAIEPLASGSSTLTRLSSGDKIFTHAGRLHIITGYVPAAGSDPAHITISDAAYGSGSIIDPTAPGVAPTGLVEGFTVRRSTIIRAGLPAGKSANITVNISTCRATGHDFLDIGSGGFNSTNYPNNILGSPISAPVTSNEVVEAGSGRVFYVSTDQFGIFRVGKFFTVDQGTGSVTFAASIALSNLDGIGFKRGTVVKEFSTDDTMTDNADDTVPVESAVRRYIDKRLGYTHDGLPVPLIDRIPATTGGFLPISGSPTLEADLSMGSSVGHRITNLVPNILSDSDAANIGYVNASVLARDSWYKLKEVVLMSPQAGDIPIFPTTGRTVISTSISGDIGGTFTSTNITELAANITGTSQLDVSAGVIVNDITGFPSSGYFQIADEIFSYTSITTASNRFDDVTRAVGGTVGSTHDVGDQVIGLDNSRLDLQLQPGVIVNADVSASAAIEQSKIALTNVTSFVDTASTSSIGLASFNSTNFDITAGGEVTVKDKGIVFAEIQDIADGSILGNFSGSAGSISEVSSSNIVTSGVNSLFTTIDTGSAVMTRRADSIKTTATFTSITGTPPSGSGTIPNLPAVSISGSGYGARVTVGYSSGSFSGVSVDFGGNDYAEGDILTVKGSLFPGGIDGEPGTGNDIQFTIETTTLPTPSNIDSTVYLGLQRVSKLAEPDSLVLTDGNKNLGSSSSRFNEIHATSIFADDFTGDLTGNVVGDLTGTATRANNLSGITVGIDNIIGSIPYQSADNTTTLLRAGTSGRYLKTQGPGNPPVWSEIIIPDGSAESLTGVELASNVVTSSLTSVGTLTSLTVSGNLTIATNKLTVNSTTGAVGINNDLTVGGDLKVASGFTSVSVDGAIIAGGINQSGATPLESNINIISSSGINSGVRLPEALAGLRILIKNTTTNDVFIYPGTGAKINDSAINDPVLLEADACLEYFCSVSAVSGSGGTWNTINATFA